MTIYQVEVSRGLGPQVFDLAATQHGAQVVPVHRRHISCPWSSFSNMNTNGLGHPRTQRETDAIPLEKLALNDRCFGIGPHHRSPTDSASIDHLKRMIGEAGSQKANPRVHTKDMEGMIGNTSRYRCIDARPLAPDR